MSSNDRLSWGRFAELGSSCFLAFQSACWMRLQPMKRNESLMGSWTAFDAAERPGPGVCGDGVTDDRPGHATTHIWQSNRKSHTHCARRPIVRSRAFMNTSSGHKPAHRPPETSGCTSAFDFSVH